MSATTHAGGNAAEAVRLRHAMVASQLRTNAVNDPRVVAALADVPRERFVPSNQAPLAYRDTALPLGGGRLQNNPLATARLIGEAGIGPDDAVLVVGAAGGYTVAVVSRLARRVVGVESEASLAALAHEALANFDNVEVVEGDLAAGAEAQGPYDVMIVDGAVEQLPMQLIDQVKLGGRVASGVIENGVTRLATGTRTAGGFALVAFADIDCVPLPGFAKPRGFQFPG